MPTLTPVAPANGGTVSTPATPSGGADLIANPNGTLILRISNASGGSMTATIAAGASPTRPADATYPPMDLAANVITIANNVVKIIGPVKKAYNDAQNRVSLTCSATSSVTVEAIQP